MAGIFYQTFVNIISTNDSYYQPNPFGATGFLAMEYPASEATVTNPSVLFYGQIPCFAVNFGDGKGWSMLSDGNGVYQTLTNTQKANITALFSALGDTREFPGRLYSVLVQGW